MVGKSRFCVTCSFLELACAVTKTHISTFIMYMLPRIGISINLHIHIVKLMKNVNNYLLSPKV